LFADKHGRRRRRRGRGEEEVTVPLFADKYDR